ncbi:Reverse transcriptase RNA-dependent DNA polymerase [Arabidopsis thaliana x Arabidopsis arenosa]|uniref:Reverse transcriptase RNA-dependent DNA polymerase n=1 Tax=Arabidopsis thaliana x Arabidopsis arenosa TaxID=1240361 RepID=A0A8T1Y473_9BRAS|nr:Reverse transcriptase RNA-dependent DNA polymerase [Arabidopsis thaliana x Arabidopsis arenosa]
MPLEYWSFAFATAVYLINRLPSSPLQFQVPFELLFQEKPNYSKLRVFGCLCYPWLRPYSAHKLDSRSSPCVFVGYSLSQSAYLCFDRSSSRLYSSRHVEFFETSFPFKVPNSVPSCSSAPEPDIIPLVSPLPPPLNPVAGDFGVDASPGDLDSSSPPVIDSSSSDTTIAITPGSSASSTSVEIPASILPASVPLPASSDPPPNSHPMVTRSKNQIVKPNPRYALNVVTTLDTNTEPRTHIQALKDPRWRGSMGDEINSQVQNNTWNLVPPNPSYNLVGCRWVFRIKRKADGSVDRFKSRLVAKGFHQRPGIDYFETFSPVVKQPTIRLVLGQAVSRGWVLRQLDVNNAFLQGELSEDVYMAQPPGFIDEDRPDFVCKLNKAIYGLKQAPRAWYNALRTFLVDCGFYNSVADTSLFVLHKLGIYLFVLVYVDDIVVTGNSASHVQAFIDLLAARFSIKDMGELSYFLGIEVTRTEAGLTLTQTKYINDLLHRTNMVSAKPVSTPMEENLCLSASTGPLLDDPAEYRSVIGSLQYLQFTRPDISFAVNRLSQYMHEPRLDHWLAAKRVLQYLSGTKSTGLFFSASSPLTVHAFSDADWAGDKDNYSSTGGYLVYVGQHLVAWSSKKQKTVARSSTEAEYKSVANTASEVLWVVSLLAELGLPPSGSPVIYCDNMGATYLSSNPVFHSRMKHVAVDFHFVRDLVQSGSLRVTHVSSHDQLADALTKPLSRSKFSAFCHKLGLASLRPA